MTKTWAVLLVATAAAMAQKPGAEPKKGDMCAPPPGLTAPKLPARLMSGQGPINFPITTTNPQAQAFFNQGVAQMHSFWAVEAERSFLQAAELDKAAPMPWWGIAMVAAGDYRPRFQLDPDKPVLSKPSKLDSRRQPEGGAARAIEAAKKAMELSAVPGKATPLEKLYIVSIAARRDQSSKNPDEGYIQGLRNVVASYPDEVEAKSYLALHLMRGFTTPDKAPREGSMEAAAILRDLLVKAPDHMGVHHYVIHGFEGSTFAKDAWASCRRYPELVPNIPHALHMPGHIWAQTGKWDEAVTSFSDAARNELGYIRADDLYGRGHHGHNVHFLVASLTHQGQYEKALEAATSLLEFQENPREAKSVDNFWTAYRQGWFSVFRTIVHFEKWDVLLDGKTLPVYDKPREQAWRHWGRALAFASKGDLAQAGAEAKLMDASLKEWEEKVKESLPEPLVVAREELKGHLALAAKKTAKGLELLQAASTHERALRYNEPPLYPRPVAEVLGRKALAAGKFQLAESAFKTALEQYPESTPARAGLAEALKKEGKTAAGAGGL